MTRARLPALLWLIAPLCALAALAWVTQQRAVRVQAVNALASWSGADPVDPSSATGYAGGRRTLIVPERNEKSFEWITQTQLLLADGKTRIRHVAYDNVPAGRAVDSTSPYRWWLASLAWLDHVCTGQPLGRAVERAALLADPLLLALAVVSLSGLCARAFGRGAAAGVAVGLVALFPLAAAFLPAGPDDRGAAALLALGSVLVLLAGLGQPAKAARWFAGAGLVGGLGVWLHAPTQIPILLGLFLGGAAAIWIAEGGMAPETAARNWRAWSLSGALAILAGYLAEYSPAHLASWRLESIHPLYGLGWIGLGELLIVLTALRASPGALRTPRFAGALAASLIAIAAAPLVMWRTGTAGFLARDLLWARLASLPDSACALSLKSWCHTDGASPALVATLAPLGLLLPAGWLLCRRTTPPLRRALLALALGPALVALGFACTQLRWWTVADAALLGCFVALTATGPVAAPARWRWLAPLGLAAALLPGIYQLLPRSTPAEGPALTASEAQELIERHLAHWLAARTPEPGAVVYAPPHVTTTLAYYGGLRGLGTFAPENEAGFGTSLAIAAAKTMEEAEALLRGRSVRYLVIPSWDPFFDNFARLYLAQNFSNRTSLLITELRRWNLPPWLRPLPYQLPVGGAFQHEAVRVFEVVDEQSPATATARLAEYLLETGELESAAAIGERLRRYPGDVGALAARAQVLLARSDTNGAAAALGALEARLATGADRYLAWDRRVSLALTLAQADKVDLAIAQTRRCLAEIDAAKLHTLSTASLYNFQLLARAVGLSITDPALRELAHQLLPEDLRASVP